MLCLFSAVEITPPNHDVKRVLLLFIMITERQVTEVSSDQLFEFCFSIIDVLGLLTEGQSLENVMLYYCANCFRFISPGG